MSQHHCSNNTHDCKCHSENLIVVPETNTGIKVVNYIMAESTQTLYGTIYYDIAKDMLFFKNKKGIEYELFSKIRTTTTYPIIQETKHTLINPFVFRGTWTFGYTYAKNDIISDPYTKDIWIAMCDIDTSCKIDCNWALLIPYPKIHPIITSNNDEQSEVINNCFFDTTESHHHHNHTTHSSIGIPFFYGILVTNDTKYTIDHHTKISITLNDTPENNISKQDMFQDIKLEKKNEIIIPINFVGKNDTNYFDYKQKTIYIINDGYYKITYNIVCNGIDDLITTYINLTNTESEQVCASIKKTKSDDSYPTYISHVFVLPVDSIVKVDLVCSYAKNVPLYVTPVNTWITIEYMNTL